MVLQQAISETLSNKYPQRSRSLSRLRRLRVPLIYMYLLLVQRTLRVDVWVATGPLSWLKPTAALHLSKNSLSNGHLDFATTLSLSLSMLSCLFASLCSHYSLSIVEIAFLSNNLSPAFFYQSTQLVVMKLRFSL